MSELKQVEISNFRSISRLTLQCSQLDDGSRTYGLIGLNEAGKSSILKAIALGGSDSKVTAKDFHDKKEPICIEYTYSVEPAEMDAIGTFLLSEYEEIQGPIRKDLITFGCRFTPSSFNKSWYIGTHHDAQKPLTEYVVGKLPAGSVHVPIFWAARDNYLISQAIDLAAFSSDPAGTSVPLRNCFRLAGIDDIAQRIAEMGEDSTEIDQLQRELGGTVTKHIQTVWPDHPVEITFLVNEKKINFHVRDTGLGKARTIDQRSDGFKQFISFLLTVSAQNRNQEFSRSILLLDEPETHLHPLAQEYLLTELVKITSNERDNIAFFATHSNHMIDKRDLSRNLRVTKNHIASEVTRFDKKVSTYASVSYEVFSVLSRDFHTELYSQLHDDFQEEDLTDEKRGSLRNFDEVVFHQRMKLDKDKPWKGTRNQITLPTYVRNCIHHPDNGDKFSEAELKESIEKMKKEIK